MKRYDYLIIGGGIAGVTAAETIREKDLQGSIAIISQEPHLLYSRVMLPGFLKNRVPRENLFLRKSGDFVKRKIDLRLEEEVKSVDVKNREVEVDNGERVGYKKLLLAPGGRVMPFGKSDNHPFIHRLQTLDDADKLHQALSSIKAPLVVGGSFISLEFIDIFALRGILPAVLVKEEHFFKDFADLAGGELLHENFDRHGVRIQFNDTLTEVVEGESFIEAHTKGARVFRCDAVCLGIGISRNVDFLRGSGIMLGDNGVRTSQYLETNTEGVYAAGDIAEFYDVISGKYQALGNWNNAFLQGQLAGLNMAGEKKEYRNVASYSISNLGWQLTALGDLSEGESVARINRSANQYERLALKDGRITGAFLINRFVDKPHLVKLIESRTDVRPYRGKLESLEFDIRSIAVI